MKIILTKDQWDKLPYKTTKKTRGSSYGEIIADLENAGIHNYRWTRLDESDVLEFPVIVERPDRILELVVKMEVPQLYYKPEGKRSRAKAYKPEQLEKISWRIFRWYLKSKLEAIEYGLSDLVTEFMPKIKYSLPDGRESNLYEVITRKISTGDLLEGPFEEAP